MRSEVETELALSRYSDMVRRICFVHLKNEIETQDVFQEVFLKYILFEKEFDSDVHEKAWLVRVTINACKDTMKSFARRHVQSIETLSTEPIQLDDRDQGVMDAILQLPPRYRRIIYLFYYEGYTAVEIGQILHKNPNTIYTWLDRARRQLKTQLGGAVHEG